MLPVPAKYRELMECARTLGIKEKEDEKDLIRGGYFSFIEIRPRYPRDWTSIENTQRNCPNTRREKCLRLRGCVPRSRFNSRTSCRC